MLTVSGNFRLFVPQVFFVAPGRERNDRCHVTPRSVRRLGLLTAAIGTATVVIALAASAIAPAAPLKAAASHKCLVMTGAGDPTFVRNFNPFTATGLPSGQFTKGAFYEGLIVSPEGGKPPVPWLAQSWKWSNGNKTLTLNIAQNVKWSDGQPLTSADVVYSLTAGKQSSTMDLVGYTRAGSNIASVTAKGKYQVVINLKTPDSQFIASTLNARHRGAAARLVEDQGSRRRTSTRIRSDRARSRRSHGSRARTTS